MISPKMVSRSINYWKDRGVAITLNEAPASRYRVTARHSNKRVIVVDKASCLTAIINAAAREVLKIRDCPTCGASLGHAYDA